LLPDITPCYYYYHYYYYYNHHHHYPISSPAWTKKKQKKNLGFTIKEANFFGKTLRFLRMIIVGGEQKKGRFPDELIFVPSKAPVGPVDCDAQEEKNMPFFLLP
jgi:hypothetical protein